MGLKNVNSPTYERVVQLSMDGKRAHEIAREVGCSIETVRSYRSAARKRGIDLPPTTSKPLGRRFVALRKEASKRLGELATAGGTTVEKIADEIITSAVNDREFMKKFIFGDAQ